MADTAPVVGVEVPAEPSMVHLLRTTAVSLAPSTTDVDRLSDLALAVSEAAIELLRLDGASRMKLRIEELGDELRTYVAVSASVPDGWEQRWQRSISALVLNSVVDDVRVEAKSDGAEIGFSFRPTTGSQ
jgi:hypothetical protein